MNTTAQVKQAFKKSGQQIQQEPLELLKNIKGQVTGENLEGQGENPNYPPQEDPKIKEEENLKKQVDNQDARHLEALENELKDIRRQKLFNELLQRIQAGEEIPLEEFTELSYEQRDVLKAHYQSVQNQKAVSQNQNDQLIEPSTRKGRQLIFDQKQAAQKQQTRVEKIVPPSG